MTKRTKVSKELPGSYESYNGNGGLVIDQTKKDDELMSQAEYDAMIDAEDPDVDEVGEVFVEPEGKDLHQDLVELPDIASIDLGSMKTKSARIRYLRALGYTRSAVAEHLGIRYQHVFNVEKMEPKRAAREDFPEMVVLRTDVVSGDQGLDNPTTLNDLGLVG